MIVRQIEAKEGEPTDESSVGNDGLTVNPVRGEFKFTGMSRRGGCSQRLTLVSGPVTCQFPHGVLFRSR